MDNNKNPKVSPDERKVLQEVTPLIKVDEERLLALQQWVADGLRQIENRKRLPLQEIQRTREVLDSKNPDPPMRAGASNLSVPLLISEHAATHASIRRNIFGHKPPVKVKLAGGIREVPMPDGTSQDLTGPMNRFSSFIDGQLRNTRALNAEACLGTVAATQSSDGTGQWAIVCTPPLKMKVYRPGGPVTQWTPASVRWMPLRFEDIIFFNGYGTDFAKMPFCGFKVQKTWADIKLWKEHGYYYKDFPEKIEGFYKTTTQVDDDRPPDQRVHEIAEIYLAYDIDGDGFLEQVMLDFHTEAEIVGRVSWNRFGMYRPIVGAQYDLPAKPLDYLGSGLGRKLEGAQTEASMIHNLGIESGKRGIANILVGKSGTGIDTELGGSEVVIPGDYYATETPKEDLQSIPLGDPRAVEVAVLLEGVNQQYAMRITGRDEGAQGQLQAGKRVSPKIGVPILREGRIAREQATNNLGAAMQEAVYLTIMAWQFQKPELAFQGVLEPEDIGIIESLVFSPSTAESDLRDRIVVNVVARDVAATEEQRQQKLMLMNQFIVSWYNNIVEKLDKIVAAYANPQTAMFAEPLRAIYMEVIEKLRNSLQEMLRLSEEVEDPEDFLMGLEPVKAALDRVSAVSTQMTSGMQQPQQLPPMPPQLAEADLGGGVA